MDVAVLVVLVSVPALLACTGKMTVQLPLGGIVKPLKVTDVAVILKVPAQIAPAARMPTIPCGKGSVRLTPVSVMVVLGFATERLKDVVPPSGMGEVKNAFDTVGGRTIPCVAFLARTIPAPESRSKPTA